LRSWLAALGAARVITPARQSSQHLGDLEDIYLAERALKRIRAGNDGAVPLEKIMKRYGMED
jgi:predicted DNA-binding protein